MPRSEPVGVPVFVDIEPHFTEDPAQWQGLKKLLQTFLDSLPPAPEEHQKETTTND